MGQGAAGLPSSFTLLTSYSNTGTGSNGSVQTFTAPASKWYKFVATGATASNAGQTARYCGKPAVITSTFQLIAGQTVNIVVGQQGSVGDPRPGWGGGGGSFVYRASDNFLIAAAGGCGAPHDNADGWSTYQNASLTTAGQPGSNDANVFATGGNGGIGNGGGGAGWLQDGSTTQTGSYPNVGGKTRVNGWTGGDRGGGFGGGGGCTNTWGGGGGGYTGGYSGYNASPYAGGGGGSFVCASEANDSGLALYTSKVLSSLDGYTMAHGSVLVYQGNT